MAKNDFTTKIEDGRIIFMTSYRDEFGETKEVANVITKDRLIEIRNDINRALANLSDENSNCNIPHVVGRSEQFTCSCGIPPAIRLCEGVETCLKCGERLGK